MNSKGMTNRVGREVWTPTGTLPKRQEGMGHNILFPLLSVYIVVIGGCGYSTDSLYRKNVGSVYVEMFQSKEFRRGIEFQLTEALRKEINRRTPYKNVPRERADTILTGEILEWQESAMSHQPFTSLPRDSAATLIIRCRWQDVRTGKILFDQQRLLTTVQYVRPIGETEDNARNALVVRLARKIVDQMAMDW